MKGQIQKQKKLLAKLENYGDFVRGSINSVCATCNRAHCICRKKTSRRAYRLTYKDSKQRTRIVYIPRDQLPQIRRRVANYAKWRKTMEQIMEMNINIFKLEARR
jgi:hypothetical protein